MSFRDNRRHLLAVVFVLTAGSLLYRALYAGGLEQTSALFIGLPALLAVILLGSARPKSAMGIALFVTTLVLLMSGIVLGEGFICILIASPLFYLVTILVILVDEFIRRRKDKLRAAALLPFALLALEGVLPGFEFQREESVWVETTFPMSIDRFEQALAHPPVFEKPLPVALRPGFPRPLAATGQGLAPGDRRRIAFTAGKGSAEVEFKVVRASVGRLDLALVSDQTSIAHWLTWRGTQIQWWADGAGTRVRLELDYRRELDPAWYFAPLERAVVREAGRYLIQSLAAGR